MGLKKKDRIIKRMLDGGQYRENGNGFITRDHTMAVIIPPNEGHDLLSGSSFAEEILSNENVEIEAVENKMFNDIFMWNVTASAYSLEMLTDAINFLSLTDKNMVVLMNRKRPDHPIELRGQESGIRIMVAPRIDTDGWDDDSNCEAAMKARAKERKNYLAREKRKDKKMAAAVALENEKEAELEMLRAEADAEAEAKERTE